jgi:hypothetical protein
MMFVSGKNEKMPQMIDTLDPDKDVTPEEAMIIAGSIYGGCYVNVSIPIGGCPIGGCPIGGC